MSSIRTRKPRDHVSLAVSDGEKSFSFYDAVLATVGAKRPVAHLVIVFPCAGTGDPDWQ